MFFWKPGNACGGESVREKYASGKEEGPRKGR